MAEREGWMRMEGLRDGDCVDREDWAKWAVRGKQQEDAKGESEIEREIRSAAPLANLSLERQG